MRGNSKSPQSLISDYPYFRTDVELSDDGSHLLTKAGALLLSLPAGSTFIKLLHKQTTIKRRFCHFLQTATQLVSMALVIPMLARTAKKIKTRWNLDNLGSTGLLVLAAAVDIPVSGS